MMNTDPARIPVIIGVGQINDRQNVHDALGLMVAAVERRFGVLKVPHRVEWLSDNGGAYIAADTADTARALGLTLLFTPVRSPESNGMSESFVKTLKRDYARLAVLPDAETILAKLPGWIEDYCEVHPHSGLKFRSPREFIRLGA